MQKTINFTASTHAINANKEEIIMQKTVNPAIATRTAPIVDIADIARIDNDRRARTANVANLTDLSRAANIAARRLSKTIFNPTDAMHPLTRLKMERVAKYGPIINRMRNCGLSARQIAAYVGLNQMTVYKYIREFANMI